LRPHKLPSRKEYIVEEEIIEDENLIYPVEDMVEVSHHVPNSYRKELNDIYKVIQISDIGSAILSRRLLERFLKEHYSIEGRNLKAQITGFIGMKSLPNYMKTSLQHIRQYGNMAAHGASVTKEQANYLAAVIKQLFDFAFVQPAITKEMETMLKGDATDKDENA